MSNRNVLRLIAVLIVADLVWLVCELFPTLPQGLWINLVKVLNFTQWSQLGWLTLFCLLFVSALVAKIYPDFKQWLAQPPPEKHLARKRREKDNLSPALKRQLDDRRRFGR